ncbi:MAG: uracil-DNA glycosylase [bacterium]|nr:uracil-DNA glycosylase [bacterium]
MNPVIESSWKKVLEEEFKKPTFKKLKQFIVEEIKSGKKIYPPPSCIFAAFNKTPFSDVRVVILGQDPYHGKGQAHGLCFSVPNGVTPPPSLVNICKEIHTDLGVPLSKTGDLGKWATQGVLLLNATLTVRAGEAGSHQHKGWEEFTDAIIQILSEKKQGLVFLLWGRYAQSKEVYIDPSKHLILKAPHPSPFSAYTGFFGCKHFSKTNEFLRKQKKKEIDWSLS